MTRIDHPITQRLFIISILFKAFDGFAQFVIGTLLFFNTHLVQNAIEEFADRGIYISPHTEHFARFYLLAHGMINMILALGLWKRKRWAYLWALIFLNILIAYQIVRISYTHSVTLFLLTLVDAGVIFIIYRDYKLHFKES